jgi:NAD(P)-dependent dehydrogenase (short-subunit alcohol dehydrogenase family)
MSNSHSNTPVITLITGCSRSLGLELATQLLACSPNNFVICAARNPSAADELMALVEKNEGRVECVQMDVGDADSVTVR